MEKDRWLLLSIGEGIEPIQLQKLLFKFAKESEAPGQELYEFVPYSWGPCSFEIYDDLGSIKSEGLIETVPRGIGWNSYRLTDKGKEVVRGLRNNADAQFQSRLAELDDKYAYVTSRTFGDLLRDVYAEYPEFATKSFFRG